MKRNITVMKKFVCPMCKSNFKDKHTRIYCSTSCSNKNRTIKKITILCANCNKLILCGANSKIKFCSLFCVYNYKKKNYKYLLKNCLNCKKELKLRKHSKKKFCSKKCSSKGKFNNRYGKSGWSKGLTKETDERVRKQSINDKHERIIREQIICLNCNKIFRALPKNKRKYCSLQCSFDNFVKTKSRAGKNNSRYGKSPQKVNHSYKNYYRNDLQKRFRSSWEANVARILNYLNIKWEYEIERFYFEDCTYLPDFKIDQNNYIEVKGYWTKDSSYKTQKFIEEYPDKELIIIDKHNYEFLKNQYRSKIANWEN